MNDFATFDLYKRLDNIDLLTLFENDNELSMIDEFVENCNQIGGVSTIFKLFKRIDRYGYNERYFRNENLAHALPSREGCDVVGDDTTNLRLYVMIYSENIFILFNGGIKTADTAQECPNVSIHFNRANRLCKAIVDQIGCNMTTEELLKETLIL